MKHQNSPSRSSAATLAAALLVTGAAACSGGGGADTDADAAVADAQGDTAADEGSGAPDSGGDDVEPDAGDSTGDDAGDDAGDGEATDENSGADADGSDDAGDDAEGSGDVPSDVGPSPCDTPGAVVCSDDAYDILTCVDGFWQATPCMRDRGMLCEAGECVPPWRYGDPTWSTCADHPSATAASLAEKAAYYDDIAQRLHVHPQLGWMMGVTLQTETYDCEGGTCTRPVRDHNTATWEDVAQWHTGENDGLWSGLYLASQAFRYAVTGSEDALAMIRLMLDAEVDRMAITGVPGVFTRQLIPPGVPGIACPSEDAEYTTDVEKDDNRWVQIREDGCAWVIPHETGVWTQTDHCGFERFAGWCWLDNVSQDEYAGHMFALAALWLLVDDDDVRAKAAELIEQVGVHLMENELVLIDWDGRPTEHGVMYATSLAGFPGFLASEALGFTRMAAVVSGRDDLAAFYDECLVQRSGRGKCLSWPREVGVSYLTRHLPELGLYIGGDGCRNNYNNHSMAMSYLWVLLQFETEPALREAIQQIVDERAFNADHPRAIGRQGNAWYNAMWASMKRLGPGSTGPDFAAVEAGNCAMREFPENQVERTMEPPAEHPHFCESRLGGSETELPIPVSQRCPATFTWWRSPFERRSCTANDAVVRMPADYLLSYWMARYYGFVGAED